MKETYGEGCRPTCEVCGLVELIEENQLIWYLFNKHLSTMVFQSGMGGFTMNIVGIEKVAKHYEIDDDFEFLERIEILANTILKPKKLEKEETQKRTGRFRKH